jgi:signal transduction histidine kinase
MKTGSVARHAMAPLFERLQTVSERLTADARCFACRVQGFALLTVLIGLVCQLGTVAFVTIEPDLVGTHMITEVVLLSVIGAMISVGALLVSSRRALWAMFGFRALAFAGLMGSLHAASAMLLLMAAVPPLVVLAPAPWPPSPAAAAAVLGALFAATVYLLTQHYREMLVERSKRITNLEQAFQQLTDSNLGLQLYASNAETESASRERARKTRELHDSVGYALTNFYGSPCG